jgi:hypothetical protein
MVPIDIVDRNQASDQATCMPGLNDTVRASERMTLSLAMQSKAHLDAVRDAIEPGDFSNPYDATIFSTITRLIDEGGTPNEPVALAKEIIKSGVRLPTHGYIAELFTLAYEAAIPPDMTECYTSEVARAASVRRLSGVLAAATKANQEGRLDDAIDIMSTAGRHAPVAAAAWEPEDITDVITGTRKPVLPEIAHRRDGVPLLYRGKEHSIAGEPESGKTWFALMCVADVLERDGRVVYVDFEDDAATVVGRLLDLGVLPKRLRADAHQFRYVSPDRAPGARDVVNLITFNTGIADLLVYDGWTEGASLVGLDVISGGGQGDVAKWRQMVVKPATKLGTATLITDHVVKSKEARGRYGIGAQHKLAGLTGVMFMVEVTETWGRGAKGRSKILITKDRNGGLRPHGKRDGEANMTHIGDLVGDATSGEMTSLMLWPPFDGVIGQDGPPAGLMKIIDQIEVVLPRHDNPMTRNAIEDRVVGRAADVGKALAWMEDHGRVKVVTDGRSRLHQLV